MPRPARRVGYYESTHRPFQCLVFLLPLVVLYEVGMVIVHRSQPAGQGPDLAAQLLLQWFFSLFGATGYYLPGFALIAVLLAWHVATRDSWKFEWAAILGMWSESVLWSLPLLALNRFLSSQVLAGVTTDGFDGDDLLLSIGAGIYEELLFRLIVISLLMILFKDVGGMRQTAAVAFSVVLSSVAFAGHHYQPIGGDVFTMKDFIFRTMAGAYLAAIFVFRGFGIAVGCHALYDVIVVAL